ncbi:MAG TPA: hypothetical protein VF292_02750 [Rhodanobacteraceae bacterium]
MKKQTTNRTGKAGRVHFTTGMVTSIVARYPVSTALVTGLAALFKAAGAFMDHHPFGALSSLVIAVLSFAMAFRLAADQDTRVRQ